MKKITPLILCMLTIIYNGLTQVPVVSASQNLSLQCVGGTDNRSSIAFNPNQQLYYSVIAGSVGYHIETYDQNGNPVNSVLQGFDYRGLWWNSNSNKLEGNGYNTFGIWTQDLDINSHPYPTGSHELYGVSGPNPQCAGDYDWNDDEIIYYYNGAIFRYDRTSHNQIGNQTISNLPTAITNINKTNVVYTGIPGMEVGIYDYNNKALYFIDKNTGVYQATCQLPQSAPAANMFRVAFANNHLWLYDTQDSQWKGYEVINDCESDVKITVSACDYYDSPTGNYSYTSSGLYMDTLQNSNGCDSIISIDLTILKPSYGEDVIVACDSFTWIDGITYTSSNNSVSHKIPNAAGCDSIVTLNLTITHPTYSLDKHTVCDSFTWIDGNTYTQSNTTATHVLTNAAGCDSIITLNLQINHTTYSTDTQFACDDYTWIDGNTYFESNNTATFRTTNSMGCDSIITLDLTLNPSGYKDQAITVCYGETYTVGNYTHSTSGEYYDTLQTAHGCDSIVRTVLTVEEKIDTYVERLNNQFKVNQAGATTYQWINCDLNQPILGATNRIFTAKKEGEYAVEVTVNNCMEKSICNRLPYMVGLEENNLKDINVYPNPFNHQFKINLNQNYSDIQVSLIDITGKTLLNRSYKNKTVVELNNLELPSGVYFVKLSTKNLEKTVKVVKQ